MSIADGGRETIVRVNGDMYLRMDREPYRPLTVTYVEQVPDDKTDIGIVHFEDAPTGRIGTLVCEPNATMVCYNGRPPNAYTTTLISERTRAQLPTKQPA